jgi:serine/threonine-protein kinase RsbW
LKPNFLLFILDKTATFTANLKSLQSMIQWIRLELYSHGFDETNIRKTELASEEALVNIIKHGYKQRTGIVEIELRTFDSHIEILLRDQGPAFNPLEREISFNPLASLEERSLGGLGILYIRQNMDEVRYSREKNSNVLVLIKKFNH